MGILNVNVLMQTQHLSCEIIVENAFHYILDLYTH